MQATDASNHLIAEAGCRFAIEPVLAPGCSPCQRTSAAGENGRRFGFTRHDAGGPVLGGIAGG